MQIKGEKLKKEKFKGAERSISSVDLPNVGRVNQ
jgi:hypothetical protein